MTTNSKILWSLVAVTFLLALYNWYDEGHFVMFQTNFLAILAGSIAIVVSTKSSKKTPRIAVLYTIAAYLLVIFGLVAYTFYAFNGPAENSSESAGHMHIIMFPILHITLTVFTLAGLEVIGYFLKAFSPKKDF